MIGVIYLHFHYMQRNKLNINRFGRFCTGVECDGRSCYFSPSIMLFICEREEMVRAKLKTPEGRKFLWRYSSCL